MELSRRSAIRGALAVSSLAILAPASAFAQLRRTPSAVLGPFYPVAKPEEQDSDLSLFKSRRAIGELIEVSGRVLNLRGAAVPGARLEVWQANAAGRYLHPADPNPAAIDPHFQGYGLLRTDRFGRYRFVSVRPGAYPDPAGGMRPPHIHLDIRGARSRLITQMLFPNDPLNARDRITAHLDRAQLIATDRGSRADGVRRLEWDIILDLA